MSYHLNDRSRCADLLAIASGVPDVLPTRVAYVLTAVQRTYSVTRSNALVYASEIDSQSNHQGSFCLGAEREATASRKERIFVLRRYFFRKNDVGFMYCVGGWEVIFHQPVRSI
jgi:hypothetical protein